MAITTTISPPALNLAHNQIPIQIDAPDAFVGSNALSIYDRLITAPDTNGDTIQIEWTYGGNDFDLTFEFNDDPDATAFEIEKYSGASTPAFQSWISSTLIPGMLAHPDVNDHFTMGLFTSGPSNGLRIRARAPKFGDLSFQLTGVGFTISSTNTTEGTTATPAVNYAARIWLSIAPTSTSLPTEYLRLPEMQAYPDSDGKINIDLAHIASQYFRDMEWPALPAANAFTLLANAPRKAYVEYAQQSGDPLVRGPVSRTAEFRILPGGVHTHDWPGIRANLSTWLTNSGAFRFLTARKHRALYKGRPHYLHFWYNPTSAPLIALRLLIRKYNTDTGTPLSVLIDAGTIAGSRVVRVPINPDLYSAAATSGASYFDASIGTQDDALFVDFSERIRFHMRPRPTGITTIEYQNSWGVVDTISLPWTRQRIAAVTKEIYERPRALNYTAAQSPVRTYAEQMVERFEIGIDQADPIDAPHLGELLLSRETYLIVGGTQRIPVRISAGSINLELQGRQGQFSPQPSLVIEMDRQVSFSRIINLTDLC